MALSNSQKSLIGLSVLAELAKGQGHVSGREYSAADRVRDEEVLFALAQHAKLCDKCGGKFPALVELFEKLYYEDSPPELRPTQWPEGISSEQAVEWSTALHGGDRQR